MIRNLFSIFDPTTEINKLPLNWTRTALGLLLIPTRICLVQSRISVISNLIIKNYTKNKTILRLGKENKGYSFILTSLFLIILSKSFLGLFSYIFTKIVFRLFDQIFVHSNIYVYAWMWPWNLIHFLPVLGTLGTHFSITLLLLQTDIHFSLLITTLKFTVITTTLKLCKLII